MENFSTIESLRARLKSEPRVVFVPTMGNLHDGHMALMRQACAHAPCVVASIFVNRLQFGPKEDFDKYPRTLREDGDKLAECGVDVVFAPDEKELYPSPQQVMVEPPPIAGELCGAFRPGHFRGVATVVLKLFNIVRPQVAVFGKKDYQQLCIIRTLVRELSLPIEIVGGETVRAPDGLALSSRNAYLSVAERREAVRLHRTLLYIKERVEAGEHNFLQLEENAKKTLDTHGWRVDYVALRKSFSLEPAKPRDKDLVVLAAAWLGATRLIDNVEFSV